MQWSKIKKRFLSHLTEDLQKRFDIHSTFYRLPGYNGVRAWVTFDKKELYWTIDWTINFDDNEKHLSDAIFEYPNLSLDEIIASENLAIRSLGYLDKRFGKRRLQKVEIETKEPLERLLYKVRLISDGNSRVNFDQELAELQELAEARRLTHPEYPAVEVSSQKLEEHNTRKNPFIFLKRFLQDELQVADILPHEKLVAELTLRVLTSGAGMAVKNPPAAVSIGVLSYIRSLWNTTIKA